MGLIQPVAPITALYQNVLNERAVQPYSRGSFCKKSNIILQPYEFISTFVA